MTPRHQDDNRSGRSNGEDRVERAARRVGRGLSALAVVALMIYLAVTYL